MSDITLGLATRQNLLALQGINDSLGITQNHLATGLKVASAIDDAVKFFQSQSLDNRANDFSERKDAIDQGISSLTAATQGISGAISILQQLQGLLNAAKTQTAAQRAAASTQFNILAAQFNALVSDASYQGLNLIDSTAQSLVLQFSQQSTSTFKIKSRNLLFSILVTPNDVAVCVQASLAASAIVGTKFSTVSKRTSLFDNGYRALQAAVFRAQAAAQTLGANVTFLQTRLSFTEQYETTLQGGAAKLTVADINLESTDLVTLQTRQQLSLQSLSIATQSEQAVLRLFH